MSDPFPTQPAPPAKPAVRSRGVWAIVFSVLAAVAALEPAVIEAVLTPVWALCAAIGLEAGPEAQARTTQAAQAIVALAAAVLMLLSRFVSPDGAVLRGVIRSGVVVLLAVAGLGCAGLPAGLPGVGPAPPPGAEQASDVDPGTLLLGLANLGAQAYVFHACPEDARFVRVRPGATPQLSCGSTPMALLECPEPGQVVVGVDVYVDPADGQKRAMPVCEAPAGTAE